MNYPTIGEYNKVLQVQGSNAFRTLKSIHLIPSRTSPIKVYLFGSGAFAAVFKGSINGGIFALRCFLSADNESLDRYKKICNYITQLKSSWKTECEFIDNEINVNGRFFPILKMQWINGVLINEFVSANLSNNKVLSQLQYKLYLISEDLEENKVGHGDLQCGNIIISGNSSSFEVKLIDYDGMYVPALASKNSIERGRSEFQHPKRKLLDFNPEMDRFSFWVMLTALEALKIDKTLWREVMQGGFNTLDNFLFTIQDFLNPNQSLLFQRLYRLNSAELNYYLDKLRLFSSSDYSEITKPALVGKELTQGIEVQTASHNFIQNNSNNELLNDTDSIKKFKIISNYGSVSILTSTFKRIGITPLELDKNTYEGKELIVSNGKESKRITLNSHQSIIEIEFN